MKTLVTGLLAIMLLINGTLNAQSNPEEHVFLLRGKVTAESGIKYPSTIKVYKENKVVETIEVKKNGKFKIEVLSNNYYTLDFTMPKHADKKVIVSTNGVFPDESPESDYFDFDIALHADKALKGINKDLLDFPTAMIQYDDHHRALTINEMYTSRMGRSQQDLINGVEPELVADSQH